MYVLTSHSYYPFDPRCVLHKYIIVCINVIGYVTPVHVSTCAVLDLVFTVA